ncbi:Hsp20/alpha crystallin family protein [Streptomyces virginiae]
MDPDKDIQITVEGDTLTVSAEHTESKEEKDHSEFRYGSSQRAVRCRCRPRPRSPGAASPSSAPQQMARESRHDFQARPGRLRHQARCDRRHRVRDRQDPA